MTIYRASDIRERSPVKIHSESREGPLVNRAISLGKLTDKRLLIERLSSVDLGFAVAEELQGI